MTETSTNKTNVTTGTKTTETSEAKATETKTETMTETTETKSKETKNRKKIHFFSEKKWIMAYWYKRSRKAQFTEKYLWELWEKWWGNDFTSKSDERFKELLPWIKEIKNTMTKDEMIMELMELLKANGRPKQAADVFESAAYVAMLESKLDQMTNELLQMRKELQEMKEQQASKSLKETLSEMVDRAQARCQQMREKLFEVKEEMHNKASEIVKAVKQKGKEALNKVSEFFGVKKKLESIRENVREGIIETDQTLARIDGFGEGMRMANE